MGVIVKREMKNFLKKPLFWIDDADITDGYVLTKEEDRRKIREKEIRKTLVSEFEMGQD